MLGIIDLHARIVSPPDLDAEAGALKVKRNSRHKLLKVTGKFDTLNIVDKKAETPSYHNQ